MVTSAVPVLEYETQKEKNVVSATNKVALGEDIFKIEWRHEKNGNKPVATTCMVLKLIPSEKEKSKYKETLFLKGKSSCSKNDNFSYEKGRRESLQRALQSRRVQYLTVDMIGADVGVYVQTGGKTISKLMPTGELQPTKLNLDYFKELSYVLTKADRKFVWEAYWASKSKNVVQH